MTKNLISKSIPLPTVIILGVILFFGGVICDVGMSRAQGQAKSKITLGQSSAQVLKTLGAPVKINYDAEIQIWFYRSSEGSVRKRLHLNQGVVVKLF